MVSVESSREAPVPPQPVREFPLTPVDDAIEAVHTADGLPQDVRAAEVTMDEGGGDAGQALQRGALAPGGGLNGHSPSRTPDTNRSTPPPAPHPTPARSAGARTTGPPSLPVTLERFSRDTAHGSAYDVSHLTRK